MSRWVLDAHIISAVMRQEPPVLGRCDAAMAQRGILLLCPVVLYEIERGLMALPEATRRRQAFEHLKASLAYREPDRRVWLRAAQMWAAERGAGRTRSDDDLLIAAFADVHTATVVTRNLRDFEGLGVPVEDWTRPL